MRRRWKLLFLVVVAAGAWRSGMARRGDLHALAQSGVNLASGKTASDLQHRARHDLLQHRLKNAIGQYRSAIGENPATFADLIRQGVLDRSDQHDEWDRELSMEMHGAQVLVHSAGADGRRYTSDDWTLRF